MSNNKIPLSNKIGEWDNGPSDHQQKVNTKNIIKRAINSNSELKLMLENEQIQINVQGSIIKNDETTTSDDMDVQLVFPNKTDLQEYKEKVNKTMVHYFGNDNVHKKSISIQIDKTINRRSIDLIVCKQDTKCIKALNSKTNKEVIFYPTLDKQRINELDKLNNSKYTKMVRAFKSCRTEFIKEHTNYKIKSFMIECLLAICKNKTYRKEYNKDVNKDNLIRFMAIFSSIKSRLSNYDIAKNLKELNKIKPLFNSIDDYENVKSFWNNLFKYVKDNYNMGK